MNNSLKKNSGKNSLLNSKSTMKEDNTVDSEILKNNLHEFYRNSKEKLIHFRDEIKVLELENKKMKEENNNLVLKSDDLHKYNDELTQRIKGMKENLLLTQKNKNNLLNSIREKRREIEFTSRNIETLKIDNNYKIQMLQNDIDHHHIVKENTIKSIRKKIEQETLLQVNLREKMAEIAEETARYKNLINDLDQHDTERAKILNKETAEMTKFLAEL